MNINSTSTIYSLLYEDNTKSNCLNVHNLHLYCPTFGWFIYDTQSRYWNLIKANNCFFAMGYNTYDGYLEFYFIRNNRIGCLVGRMYSDLSSIRHYTYINFNDDENGAFGHILQKIYKFGYDLQDKILSCVLNYPI